MFIQKIGKHIIKTFDVFFTTGGFKVINLRSFNVLTEIRDVNLPEVAVGDCTLVGGWNAHFGRIRVHIYYLKVSTV